MKTLDNIIFYDGDCDFCNYWVCFVLRNMKSKEFCFSPLRSGFASKFLKAFNIESKNISTIYFFENKRLHRKSTAVLRICRKLKSPYRFFSLFQFLPKNFSDLVYDYVAKNRHAFVKSKNNCELYENKYPELFLK